MLRPIRAISLLLVLLAAAQASAATPSVETVRRNFIGYYTAAGSSPSSARMSGALGTLESQARAFSDPNYLRGDGSWSDINYNTVPDGYWSPWDHVRRLTVMAKAYQTPGQSLYRNPSLRNSIESALAYVPKFYPSNTWPTGNWWFWTIGIPLDLGPTLVLMRDDISSTVYEDCVQTLAVHIGPSPTLRSLVGPTPVGQNLVWTSFNHLCLALLRDDANRLATVRNAMAGVVMPIASGDGVKPDGSFHQHGAQLYTGGYGGSFANDVARYALLTRDTEFALPPASLASFSDYIADGIAWSLYGNYFDASVVGREVVRPSTTGFHGVASLLQAALFDSPRATEIRSAAARMLQSWQWTLPTELAGLANNIERTGYPAAWPSGHRHYYASDYTIHRRNGWFASVKMFSRRTKSGENTNNENLLGSRQSDGRFFLSLRGDEHFGNDVIPAMDWSRLPGITVERSALAANDNFGYGTRTFAGGTSDGRNGVSAMELAPLGSTLTAKKAWFFFDDAIVFLTNSINATSANPVETIVNQWPLKDPNAPLTVDGTTSATRWALCDGIGYFFPTPRKVMTERQNRSGTWAALGGSTDTASKSATFMTLWIDHGAQPAGAHDEYIVIPNASANAMRNWAAANPLMVLANDATVSAVRDSRDNSRGIVFWSASTFDGITSDAPAVVWLTGDGATLRLSAADPNSGSGTFRITIPGRYSSRDANAVAGATSTTITISKNGGRTTTATLIRMPDPGRKRPMR